MTVRIICVGKLKEAFWREAEGEYAKRLKGFCKLELVELSEVRLSEKPSDKEIAEALKREAEGFLTYISGKRQWNIALCIEGRHLSSTEFANKISQQGVDGISDINLCIGSSFGLAEDVKSRCFPLSMSNMTFPHQLARIMLLEQVYRAFQILSGGRYHK